MAEANDPGSGGRRGQRSFKSFADFRREVEQSGQDLELWVLPRLKFGAIFDILDEDSGFGTHGTHPWVIVIPYRPGYPTVRACPRTSSRLRQSGLFIPGGVINGLDRDGIVLVDKPQTFRVEQFRDYSYRGDLPPEWQEKLKALWTAHERHAKGKSEDR